jgi:hypothetical protein
MLRLEVFYQIDHFPDGPFDAHENSACHDTVADTVLLNLGQYLERFHIDVIKAVPGTDAEAVFLGGLHTHPDPVKKPVCLCLISGVCIMSRVDLHDITATFMGCPYLVRISVHEKAHQDSLRLEAIDRPLVMVLPGGNIQSSLCGEFLSLFRHKGDKS